MSAGVVRRYMARLGLCLASYIVALLLCEGVVRLTGMGPEVFRMPSRFVHLSDNPVLRYEHVPNMSYREYVINEHGLRGRAYEKRKTKDVFRIAVVGDSVSFGWDVGEGQAWPDVLQGLLNECPAARQETFQVLNFAVTGYNATQVAEVLRQSVRSWNPDLILYGYCLNDPQEYSIDFEELLDRLSRRKREWIRASSRNILGRSRLLQLAMLELRKSPTDKDSDRKTTWLDDPQFQALQAGRGAMYFERLHEDPVSFKRLQEALAKMAGETPVIVCLFPVFGELENEKLHTVHQKVRIATEEQGLAFEDLTADFIQARHEGIVLNGDALHLTPQGHEVAASNILNIVLRYLADRR